MKHPLLALALFLGIGGFAAAAGSFNYAEALQKSLYFYEAQQSGKLSPNNRVEWRGDACLTDGADLGRDLSGGWFDAGDHWTANLTMSFAAMTLAWSAVEYPGGYLQSGQMEPLLENLVHVNQYFLRCVLNPECRDPATELEVVIGCGGREGVDPPQVHSMWGPAEMAHLVTRRPTFRLNQSVPGGDIPAAMAAAMASSSMVIREQGMLLKRRKGFERFQPAEFADLLLDRAGKLVRFARANSGPVLVESLTGGAKEKIRLARRQALRADGRIVEVGYRADPFDKLVAAASWLHRAFLAKDPKASREWLDLALKIYENEYKSEQNHDWWKDFGAGNFGKLAAYNLMRLLPGDQRFHAELQLYCSRFAEYKQTPGGLRLREWSAHEYGSLRHANNAAVIALYYANQVGSAPALDGNTWWKAGRSNQVLSEQYRKAALQQVDYALGANPYGRSYLVGFGRNPFNNVHHRGAYGSWAGFDHFIPGKADDRSTNRHVIYGALVAGPDHNDVFLCGKEARKWQALPDGKAEGFLYNFPNRPGLLVKEGYQWNAADQPVQDVMDSTFNEVALDYNAGITASFACLVAQGMSAGGPLRESEFPPKAVRNASGDLRFTDREFFAAARRLNSFANGMELEVVLHNRSRWPARVATNLSFRIFFNLEPEVPLEQVVLLSTDGNRLSASVRKIGGLEAYAEVSAQDLELHPGTQATGSRAFRFKITAPRWAARPRGTLDSLTPDLRLIPSIPVYQAGVQVGGDILTWSPRQP